MYTDNIETFPNINPPFATIEDKIRAHFEDIDTLNSSAAHYLKITAQHHQEVKGFDAYRNGTHFYIRDLNLLVTLKGYIVDLGKHCPEKGGRVDFELQYVSETVVNPGILRLSIGQEIVTPYNSKVILRNKGHIFELAYVSMVFWLNEDLEVECKMNDRCSLQVDILKNQIHYIGDFENIISHDATVNMNTTGIRLSWAKPEISQPIVDRVNREYQRIAKYASLLKDNTVWWDESSPPLDLSAFVKRMEENHPEFAKKSQELNLEFFSKRGLIPFMFYLFEVIHYPFVSKLIKDEFGKLLLSEYNYLFRGYNGVALERFQDYFKEGNNLNEILGINSDVSEKLYSKKNNVKKFCSSWMAYRKKSIPSKVKEFYLYEVY